jgi:3-oxoacyl-(acyl-carrier-protein) synthase III
MIATRVVGAGAFVPRRVVTNERIVQAIPGWSADKLAQKTGILERRFLWDFDEEVGRAIVPGPDWSGPRTNTDMCEIALRRALEMAGVAARELDGVFVVTVTPDELNFCHDAMVVHQRLGCRPDAFALVLDSGCGGALYTLDMARRMIEGGTYRTVAIVASNFASAYLDREVFTANVRVEDREINACLSMYLFGDGAGAVVLRGERRERSRDDGASPGILSSYSGADYVQLVVRSGGGALRPAHPGRACRAQHAFVVDGKLVAERFPGYMKRCLDEALRPVPHLASEVKRYYLHQANKRLVEGFAEQAGLPREKLAMHMDRYGNTSAAGTLILLAEDLADGVVRLGSGDLVQFAAIGAGVHYGGQLVRL